MAERTARRNGGDAQPGNLASARENGWFVAVLQRDEDVTRLWQRDARRKLRFGEGRREIEVNAHDFAGRFHFRRQDRVSAGETREGKNGFLYCNMFNMAINRRLIETLFALHHASGNLGNWWPIILVHEGDSRPEERSE